MMLLRTHGEMLTARRRNRLERSRLEQHLRELEKDGAKQQFRLERQRRSVLLGWQSVPLTTGYSDKAQPLDGPQDNAYSQSKHSQRRLPEKRLMQWKAQEQQLEKFLWRFETQHARKGRPTTPSQQCRSRSARAESSKISPMLFKPGQTAAEVVKSFESSLKEFRLLQLAGLAGNDDDGDDGVASSSVYPNGDSKSEVSKCRATSTDKVSTAGARSVTVASVPNADVIVRSENPFEKLKEIHDLASSDLDYKAVILARAKAATKFVVTKDKVVMKNGFLKTCKEVGTREKPSRNGPRKASRHDHRPDHIHSAAAVTLDGESLNAGSAETPSELDSRSSVDSPGGRGSSAGPGTGTPTIERNAKRVGFAQQAHTDTNAYQEIKANNHDKLGSVDGHIGGQEIKLQTDIVGERNSTSVGTSDTEFEKQKKESLSVKEDSVAAAVNIGSTEGSGIRQTEISHPQSTDAQPNLMSKDNNDDQKPGDNEQKQDSQDLSAQLQLVKSHYDRNKTHRKWLKTRQQAVVGHKSTEANPENPPSTNPGPTDGGNPQAALKSPAHDDADSSDNTSRTSSKTCTRMPNTDHHTHSKRQRDLILEKPLGLRSAGSGLGHDKTLAFSKAARQRALTSMVDENSSDIRTVIRREKLRTLQSRAALLQKIVIQFPMMEDLGSRSVHF